MEIAKESMTECDEGVRVTITTDPVSEKSEVLWAVPELKPPEQRSWEFQYCHRPITFRLGQNIGLPSTWSFSLQFYGEMDDKKNWIMVPKYSTLVLEDAGEFQSLKASYSIKFLDADSRVIRTKEYGVTEMFRRSKFVSTYRPYKFNESFKEVLIVMEIQSTQEQQAKVEKTREEKALWDQIKDKTLSDFGTLLKTGDGADLDIKVMQEGSEVECRKAHKLILMARSRFFVAMFSEDNKMMEARESEWVLKDISPKGLDVLLEYLYTGNINPNWTLFPGEILNAANKYDLTELKAFFDKNLSKAFVIRPTLKTYWTSQYFMTFQVPQR